MTADIDVVDYLAPIFLQPRHCAVRHLPLGKQWFTVKSAS